MAEVAVSPPSEAAVGPTPRGAGPAATTPFADIGGSFAATAIAQIYGLGSTAGVGATHYGPANAVARDRSPIPRTP